MRNSFQLFVSFAVSTAVLLFGIYVLFGMNMQQWQVVKDVRVRLAERQAVMDQLTDLINKFRERVASFDNLNTQIDLVNTALPASLNVPELLVSLEAMATEGQVTVESVAFTSVDVQSGQGSQAAKDTKKVKVSEPLPLQITVNGSGNYKAVKDFIKGLEEELRLVDMRDVTFRPATIAFEAEPKKKATTTEEFSTVFNFQINANAYYIEKPSFTLP